MFQGDNVIQISFVYHPNISKRLTNRKLTAIISETKRQRKKLQKEKRTVIELQFSEFEFQSHKNIDTEREREKRQKVTAVVGCLRNRTNEGLRKQQQTEH